MRRTVMQLQSEGNVPASKCGQVIKVVSEQLFDVPLSEKEVPCVQTAVNIADEGHVLAKIQATEEMLAAENFTLHADGTSRGGTKITGHQITLDDETSLSLGFSTVACEDATTLLELTVGLFKEICDLYCEDQDEAEHIFRMLLTKLTSVMTDRAAVMKAFDAKLLAFLQTELGENTTLHFLYCNAHFVLGSSRSTCDALKMRETEICEAGTKLGRDSLQKFKHFCRTNETATTRVIRLVCDITGPRGDDKNGIRGEWIAFCAEKGIASCMTSYRSNRFNCFFQAAAAIIHHRDHLKDLLSGGYISHTNLKTESVMADIQDDTLMSLVCAVALLYLRVTGPFFQLVKSQVKFSDLYKYVQKMEACFDRWRNDASDLLDANYRGIFDGEFELASKMAPAVFEYTRQHAREIQVTLEFIMRELLLVTRRQLGDFLPGGTFGAALPPHLEEELKHCPLTNLLGENVFGELDFDMNKKRNSSFHHRSSTQMMKHNKTSNWLNNKRKEEASKLLLTARKKAKPLRDLHRQQEQLVVEKVRQRLLENERKKRLKEAAEEQKKANLIRRVVAHGGPCLSALHVRDMVNRLQQEGAAAGQIKKTLADEIRYQKTVRRTGKELRLTGTIQELQDALQRHLGGVDDQHEDQPTTHDMDTNESEERLDEENLPSSSTSERLCPDEETPPFNFTHQGEWVAVYYDTSFYVGQVIDIDNPSLATVQFLSKCKGRDDYFRWPDVEDVAKVDAIYVFRANVDVFPVGVGRVWKVSSVDDISEAYARLRRQIYS